jgi:predicted  nucleic acid-binding Zn-ribbon protein
MTAQATLLHQLQGVDLNIAKRRQRLKEIAALLADDQATADARAALTKAEETLRPSQVRNRDLDLEIKGLIEKIKNTNDMLYSGKVRNPKEMQDMQQEIESLQKRQSHLEDEMIEVMMRVEEGQASVEQAQDQFKQVMATAAGNKVDLHNEQERLMGEVRSLEATRGAASQLIEPAALQKYESMRVAKRGQPVALMIDEGCKLCGVQQTSNIVVKVREGRELVPCIGCGRILAMP